MKNRLAYLVISVCVTIAMLWILPGAGQAQDAQEAILEEDLHIKFGETISFELKIEHSVAPTRSALFLRTSPNSQFQAYVLGVTNLSDARRYQSEKRFDVETINLVPFAQFEHYWQIDFSDGSVMVTDIQARIYNDERYPWKEYSRGELTIHWVDGDIEWAQEIYAIAEQALPEIRALLASPGPSRSQIYVYPRQSDLQNSLRQAGINQASAHALPELGVALVAGESDPETLIRLEQELPHELVHLLLYDRMGPSIDNLPVWLNEGLASLFEQSPRRLYAEALANAAEQDELIQMESLCTSFPIAEAERVLAYAQSASFTNYLIDIYGRGGIVRLLEAYEEGTTCTGGVQRVYQRSLDQLESEWKSTAFESRPLFERFEQLFYAAGFLILATVVFALIIIVRRRKKRMQS